MQAVPMTLATTLKETVETYVSELPFSSLAPANLYKPMEYILSMKGKRIRPILTMLTYQSISGDHPTRVIDLACAIELFHNFTLMHDDIMDRAPMRRGMPSVHYKWNEDIAILSGDALFAFSMGLVVKPLPEKAAVLAQEFSRVAMEVCEGQMEDMDLAQLTEVSIPTYIEMIRKKTAALLGGCMSLGALSAGAPTSLVNQLRQYGELLGIAFQLQDDLMDAFPPAGFGKQIGGDIIENKQTYLIIRAKELANPAQRKELDAWYARTDQDPQAKVEGVLEIFQAVQVEQHTQAMIQDYFERALTLSRELDAHFQGDSLRQYLGIIAKRQV